MKKLILALLVGLSLTSAFSQTETAVLTRAPYLQMLGPNGVHIKFRSLVPGTPTVKYGTQPNNLQFEATGAAAQLLDFTVVLENLLPNTTYYYQVFMGTMEQGNALEQHFTTHPTVGTRKKTRIWVLGDSGMNNQKHFNTRDAFFAYNQNQTPDVWLMLGDNAYLSGQDIEYQRGIFDIYPNLVNKTAIYPTFGNHDSYGSNPLLAMGPYFSVFDLPKNAELGGEPSGNEFYYSFNYANIHFVSLDANMVQFILSPSGMQEWLENDLNKNTQDYTIVFFHHPPYTKGSHDSDSESELVNMREVFTPIFEKHGVDLVLNGHSHSYERSYFLDGHTGNSASFSDANLIQKGNGKLHGDGAYRKESGRKANSGVVYVVNGSSCQSGGGSLDHSAMYYSTDSSGSMVIDIEDNMLKSVFLSEFGTILDEFAIEKQNFTSVNELSENLSLSLYPNPSSDNIQLDFSSAKAQQYTWSIINLNGQTVLQGQENGVHGTNSKVLNVKQLPSGVYQLSIRNGNEKLTKNFSKL